MQPKQRTLLPFAQKLRHQATPAEMLLWEKIRAGRLCGLKFYRQYPLPPYIVDFYCHKHGLIIEVDGDIHYLPEQIEKDQIRQTELATQGFHMLRFTNHEVMYQVEDVLSEILRFCKEKH